MTMPRRKRLTGRRLGLALVLAWLGLSLGAVQKEPPDIPEKKTGLAVGAPAGAVPAQPAPVNDRQAEALPSPAPLARVPVAPVAIEREPYHIEVRVDFDNAPWCDYEFRRRVLDEIREGLERYAGEFWQCTIAEEEGKIFSGLAGLRRLRPDTLPRDAIASDVQKVFLLSVETRGAGFQIFGREWDAVTRQVGPLVIDRAYDRREIPETALAVMHEVFRPIIAVEASKSGAITLRARGGEFPPRDESWLPLLPGRTFEVFRCFLNKDRLVERIQQVPFTYLAPDAEADRGVAKGKVTSGLRAPLTPRRRIQFLALGINSRASETRLTLVTRPPARRPLAGVEVEVFLTMPSNGSGQSAKVKTEAGEKEPPGTRGGQHCAAGRRQKWPGVDRIENLTVWSAGVADRQKRSGPFGAGSSCARCTGGRIARIARRHAASRNRGEHRRLAGGARRHGRPSGRADVSGDHPRQNR